MPDARAVAPCSPARSRLIAVAVAAALAAAFFNSLAAYLQQGGTKQLETEESVSVRQVGRLLRQPRWLLGQSSDAFAFLLQAVALAFGALIFVEPLLVMSLPFAVLLQAWSARRRPDRRGLVGSALCVLGLSLFLLLAQPTPGEPSVTLGEVLPLAIGVAVVLAVLLGAAAATHDNLRAVAFAGAAGVVFGVTAGLTKVVISHLRHGGVLEPLHHWPLYAAILTGLSGVLLTQNALKAGALAAPVAVITLGDPLTGIAVGLLWLGERVNDGAWFVAAEAGTLVVMAAGVVVLARQSTLAAAPAGERAPAKR